MGPFLAFFPRKWGTQTFFWGPKSGVLGWGTKSFCWTSFFFFLSLNPPPLKKLRKKKSYGIIFGVIATVSRNQLRKKSLWEIFSWELRKFRVAQHGWVWGSLRSPITENNSWGINFLVITQFCRNRPPKLPSDSTWLQAGKITFELFSGGSTGKSCKSPRGYYRGGSYRTGAHTGDYFWGIIFRGSTGKSCNSPGPITRKNVYRVILVIISP